MVEKPDALINLPPPTEDGAPPPPPASPHKPWWKKDSSFVIGITGMVLLLVYFIVGNFFDINDRIHDESKEIRGLVGENASKLDVLDERTSGIKADVTRLGKEIGNLDTKLDQALGIKKKAGLTE